MSSPAFPSPNPMATWSMTPGFPPREKGQIIFPGFVVLLTIILVIIAACILWSWKKQKKRESVCVSS